MPAVESRRASGSSTPGCRYQSACGFAKAPSLKCLFSGDGIFLIPSKRIPKGQRYFYTEEWQAKEREADESIARGEVTGPFSNAVAAIRALRTAKA